MKKAIQTEIIIQSTPENIWKKLTDIENYPEWNSFIRTFTGKLAIKEKIKIKLQASESSQMTFKPIILAYQENKKLIWKGKLLFKGLFDGEHTLELIDNDNGTVTFKQSEIFTGIMVRFINLDNTKKGFERMNRELKELCEVH